MKCCRNCANFRIVIPPSYSREIYHCDFHNLHNGEVTDPDIQCCEGDKDSNKGYLSMKQKNRDDKINIILNLDM